MSPAVPLIVPWIGAVLLIRADGRRPGVGWAAVALIVATLALLAVLIGQVVAGGAHETTAGDWPATVGVTLRADALGLVFALVSVAVVAAALAHRVVTGIEHRGTPAVTCFLCAGLVGLFLTGDIFNFYVFFEVAMTATYVLTAFGGQERQLGASLMFAVVNLFGTFLFLIAVAGMYHVTGHLEMRAVAAGMADAEPGAAMLIAATLFVAFAVKLGLFPFHYWLPAAYTGASAASAAVLSGAVANIGSYGLIRFGVEILPRELERGSTALIVLGCVSLVYGAMQAVHRRNVAEVLAYSAIGQVGYVLLAIGIGGRAGITAAVVYAVAVAVTKALLFLADGVHGTLVPAAFLVGVLSLVGIPPTPGFFGKVEVFRAGLEAGPVVVGLVLAGSALSFVYAFQLYQHRFWREEPPERPRQPSALAVVAVTAMAVLALGVWPQPLLGAAVEAATALEVVR